MKKILLYLFLSFPVLAFAQQRFGNLTVFSEDGQPFFLVINGEKQNQAASTNIRVEELPQPYYSAKISFLDSTIATISKNIQLVDADNKMMDVTYRIRKDKSGKTKISLYSAVEAQPDFIAPAGMQVFRFGHNNGGTTTTSTTVHSSNTVDASLNIPGVSMNISINDPDMMNSSTTTTTTTSHSSHGSTSQNQSNGNNKCRGWAMKQSDFMAAKKAIADAKFDDTRLATAKSIASNNCLSADQVVSLCNLFSFEESKLDFAKYAYSFTVDPKNYFKVNNVFSFDASKEELSRFVSGE